MVFLRFALFPYRCLACFLDGNATLQSNIQGSSGSTTGLAFQMSQSKTSEFDMGKCLGSSGLLGTFHDHSQQCPWIGQGHVSHLRNYCHSYGTFLFSGVAGRYLPNLAAITP